MEHMSALPTGVRVPSDICTAVDLTAFQDGFRHLASGVCVVTTRHRGVDSGFAATSVTSLSADPPSLLVCIHRKSRVHDEVIEAGKFCVNVLGEEHQDIAACFGNPKLRARRFVLGDWIDRGLPVLADAMASFQCFVASTFVFGSHTIVVGQINRVMSDVNDVDPLLYFRGSYRQLESEGGAS